MAIVKEVIKIEAKGEYMILISDKYVGNHVERDHDKDIDLRSKIKFKVEVWFKVKVKVKIYIVVKVTTIQIFSEKI